MIQRADFYILSGAGLKQRDVYACRLIEKAFLADCSVAVMADEESAARNLDDLLWTFRDRSFVPHQLCLGSTVADPETPVRLYTELPPGAGADLCINLSGRMPTMLENLTRIATLIDEDAERRRIGREHFKIYREHNFELQTHRIDSFD